jgi:hypothetical protein
VLWGLKSNTWIPLTAFDSRAECESLRKTKAPTGKGRAEVVRVEVAGDVKQQKRRAGSKGGHAPRAVALIGLGDPLPVVSLKSSADRMAVLEAVLSAVARGRTSGMVASTIVSIIKAANELARGDQEDAIRALEARLEALVVPRGR